MIIEEYGTFAKIVHFKSDGNFEYEEFFVEVSDNILWQDKIYNLLYNQPYDVDISIVCNGNTLLSASLISDIGVIENGSNLQFSDAASECFGIAVKIMNITFSKR